MLVNLGTSAWPMDGSYVPCASSPKLLCFKLSRNSFQSSVNSSRCARQRCYAKLLRACTIRVHPTINENPRILGIPQGISTPPFLGMLEKTLYLQSIMTHLPKRLDIVRPKSEACQLTCCPRRHSELQQVPARLHNYGLTPSYPSSKYILQLTENKTRLCCAQADHTLFFCFKLQPILDFFALPPLDN